MARRGIGATHCLDDQKIAAVGAAVGLHPQPNAFLRTTSSKAGILDLRATVLLAASFATD
eukprot:SAG11_NODE_18043_length_501_cov_1.537313_1_plen_59_part_10